jgi:hypothetical protein
MTNVIDDRRQARQVEVTKGEMGPVAGVELASYGLL